MIIKIITNSKEKENLKTDIRILKKEILRN
jgi:hypothetical protein